MEKENKIPNANGDNRIGQEQFQTFVFNQDVS